MSGPSIGNSMLSVDVDIVAGLPQALKSRVDVWQTPGLNGVGAQLLGQGATPFDLTLIRYFTSAGSGSGSGENATADSFITACGELQGMLVNLFDNWGDEYMTILVVEVDAADAKKRVIYKVIPTPCACRSNSNA